MPIAYFVLVTVLSLLCIFYTGEVSAATPINQVNTALSSEQLATAEQKLLQRTYENDSLAKRLERLELTIFGATQYGSNEQRWQRIKKSLYSTNKSKENISSSLNELEKYVFKKTSPTLSNAQRLNRLEQKLFGQPNPSMSAAFRVDRLKRTLGLASPEIAGQDGRAYGRPYSGNPSLNGLPPMTQMPMFGGTGDPELDQFQSEISQMMQDMQRQMQGMPGQNQPPNGKDYSYHYYMYSTPDGGFRIEQGPGSMQQMPGHNGHKDLPKSKKVPGEIQPPVSPQPQLIPQPSIPQDKIPSYNDPNFI